MTQGVKYSSVLQDFAAPLFAGNENREELMAKFKVAELVWNHAIAKEFELPIFTVLDQAIQESNKHHPDMEAVFSFLKASKKSDFKVYKNFIVTVEYRLKPDGSASLLVESVEPDKVKNLSL